MCFCVVIENSYQLKKVSQSTQEMKPNDSLSTKSTEETSTQVVCQVLNWPLIAPKHTHGSN